MRGRSAPSPRPSRIRDSPPPSPAAARPQRRFPLHAGADVRRAQPAGSRSRSAPARSRWPDAQRATGPTSATPVTAITPSAYNLGVSVGWRRFAISGDVAQSDAGLIPGTRESAAGRHELSRDAPHHRPGRGRRRARPRATSGSSPRTRRYSLDVGGAYSIARNVDVTAGVRYRIARDRLEPLAARRPPRQPGGLCRHRLPLLTSNRLQASIPAQP